MSDNEFKERIKVDKRIRDIKALAEVTERAVAEAEKKLKEGREER